MTYAERLKANNKADAPSSGPTQQSGRSLTPAPPSAATAPTAASAQTASPAAAPALPPRTSGSRNQSRHVPAAAAPPAAASDTSGKGDQRGAATHGAPSDKPAGSSASASGPPARPPYSAPGRGPAQGYRDDESSKKAVFVRNVPQVSLPCHCRCPWTAWAFPILTLRPARICIPAALHLTSVSLYFSVAERLHRLVGGCSCRMQLPRTSGRFLRSSEPSSLRMEPSL